MKYLLSFIFLMGFIPNQLNAASPKHHSSKQSNFILDKLIAGLSIPWGMAFLAKHKMVVTERKGNIKLVNIKTKTVAKLTGAPEILVDGQGGLLDVAVPTNYKEGDWIYFTFVREKDDGGVTVLAKAKLKNNALVNWHDILETNSATETGYHFGSRITFDNKGFIYFGVGDRGERPSAQNTSNHAGSIMRLHLEGQVPKDNPFIENKKGLPEIWSYGHRNPQGMAYDEVNNRLWSIEHGPRGGDEINLILPGRNYGWPIISYGKEYWGPVAVGEGTHRKGLEQPVKQYTPSIAPGSLLLYSGKAFPSWRGNLFAGALKLKHLNRVTLNNQAKAINEERLLTDLDERIRALTESPQGWIVLSTDSGNIYAIKPVP